MGEKFSAFFRRASSRASPDHGDAAHRQLDVYIVVPVQCVLEALMQGLAHPSLWRVDEVRAQEEQYVILVTQGDYEEAVVHLGRRLGGVCIRMIRPATVVAATTKKSENACCKVTKAARMKKIMRMMQMTKDYIEAERAYARELL
ncbi:hypothetical protein B0A55_08120 [Friedmanniomyces simplex]|uniref:Uncharacterized protein n=1 Tax=Friedmanniomyces simplex TaxID=329884 RepID=A0A4U0X3G6_9PEZI|nr:hypothetical protein B0A55_08120 [Friedmanniomyces simplex]